jgi:hypothetical protein
MVVSSLAYNSSYSCLARNALGQSPTTNLVPVLVLGECELISDVSCIQRNLFIVAVHTGGNRNAANLLLVFLNFYCLCVDGTRHAVSYYLQVRRAKKSNMFDFFGPCCPSILAILLPGCVDASVTAIAEERATANQRAAFALVWF